MFSQKVTNNLKNSSFIRAMFEEGERLRAKFGPDKVFDFSLGNPDAEPPKAFKDALKKLVLDDTPGLHRYMTNAGYPDVRAKIADQLAKESGVNITGSNVVMTVGAAGGLNVVFKSILNPDEEVIVFAPYFVEYFSYIDNHGGKGVTVKTNPSNFEPDVEALAKSITSKTKAIIINTPNNPTGAVYGEDILKKIAALLEEKEKELNTTIFVVSDEPYNKLVFDNIKVPSILGIFKHAIVVNSYSKSLAVPGERIGYIAVNPAIPEVDTLMNALIYCNRTLGYVNAPGLFQKAIAEALNATVDTAEYQKRRDVLFNHLTNLGFSCIKPGGSFYLFPKALIDDDVEFTKRAVKYNLLLVPGSGFGWPGYFRIAFCVSMETIQNSLPAFESLAKEFKK